MDTRYLHMKLPTSLLLLTLSEEELYCGTPVPEELLELWKLLLWKLLELELSFLPRGEPRLLDTRLEERPGRCKCHHITAASGLYFYHSESCPLFEDNCLPV